MVEYADVERYWARIPRDAIVVVIGYAPGTCPGTANVMRALEARPDWRNHHCFIVISRDESHDVKRRLHHSGTFPIVFVNQQYIGGGDDLLRLSRR